MTPEFSLVPEPVRSDQFELRFKIREIIGTLRSRVELMLLLRITQILSLSALLPYSSPADADATTLPSGRFGPLPPHFEASGVSLPLPASGLPHDIDVLPLSEGEIGGEEVTV